MDLAILRVEYHWRRWNQQRDRDRHPDGAAVMDGGEKQEIWESIAI